MAGDPEENEIAGAVNDRIDSVWRIVELRIRSLPEYVDLFKSSFTDISSSSDITISHIAISLAAFIGSEFRSYDSPFDSYLSGDESALSSSQKHGLELFYGKAGCSSCHSGILFTDQKFHALMLPHFGPGRTRLWEPIARDVGHMGVSDRLSDAYRFRTPSLRNVSLTSPYGHNGSYKTLDGIVRHHLDPLGSFNSWRSSNAILPSLPWLSSLDFLSFNDTAERSRLVSKSDIIPLSLTNIEVESLLSFLHSLTGTSSTKGRLGRPSVVPSKLRID